MDMLATYSQIETVVIKQRQLLFAVVAFACGILCSIALGCSLFVISCAILQPFDRQSKLKLVRCSHYVVAPPAYIRL